MGSASGPLKLLTSRRSSVSPDSPFQTFRRTSRCVEIDWRLSPETGPGYATEGASAALRFGFDTLRLGEIVATTAPRNVRSRRVMGMVHNPADDFDHPLVPDGHPLRRHVLYRLSNPEVRNRCSDRSSETSCG
jgi:RimJ/RimL family protein N-acetyltransferase